MKRILVSMFMLLLVSTTFAQVYVRVNVGYNLPMNSALLMVDDDYNSSSGTWNLSGVYGSYGSGFSAHAAFGGGFGNGVLGYDIEAGYLVGKKYEVVNSYAYSNNNLSETTNTGYARSIQFAPALTFTAGTGDLHPFARLGPVIGVTSITKREEWKATGEPLYVQEYKYSGGVAFGFKGVVGVAYSLSAVVDLFAEVDFISMSYTATKRKLEELSVDGEDQKDQIPQDRLEEDLEKDYEIGGEEYFPPVREPAPMGSIGLQFGVKFKF